MKEDNKIVTPVVIQESDIKGEKIIFDILIKQKLAHVIVVKEAQHYHINLNGEDLGSFSKDEGGKVNRYGQPRGAADDYEDYFKPIEAKLNELNK
ncbi:hypothetical protein FA048_06980 [Pedobacter polaris]|uniref:Uncharacterized protein n=1 Tax=Pedobacter polaris TaxID=2571273 RepID=A0A4U1CPG1_9SPHI|nr:hypothetical protein [Pedobacter polaris]TKC09947.1 hypothetical protein FA048_06980 [Pedobacter polaris]